MARRVITYDEAFEIIENCKPKEMDLYLEAAAKENAIGIYTEMHNYINDNIVTLDYDVDLFTEAFAWDKSKGFWANIWAWILNVWGAIKNFFLALFGKNETYSKEEVDKIKSTAEEAKSAVESGNVTLDGGALDGLSKLLEHMKKLDERMNDKSDDINERSKELSENERTKEMNEFLEKDFRIAEKAIEDCIKNKAIMKDTPWGQNIVVYLNNIIDKFNNETKLNDDQKEEQHVAAISFALLTVYNNVLIMLGFIIKNMKKYTEAEAKGALSAVCELLKLDKTARKTEDSGPILKGFGQCIYTLKELGVSSLMDIFDKSSNKKLSHEGIDKKKAASEIESATKVSIDSGSVNVTKLTEYTTIESAYNKIASEKLGFPEFDSEKFIARGNPKDIISSDEMRERSDYSKLDSGDIEETSDNKKIDLNTEVDAAKHYKLSDLKTSLPFLEKAATKVLKGATAKAMTGKDFINKIYGFLSQIKKANKKIDINARS